MTTAHRLSNESADYRTLREDLLAAEIALKDQIERGADGRGDFLPKRRYAEE